MKNILVITTVSGFLQEFEREDVKLLESMGFQVHYAANDKTPVYLYEKDCYEQMRVKFHPVEIEKSPFRLLKNFRAYKKLSEIVEEEKIEAIHCHTPEGGVLGRLLGKKCGLKVIYTAHGFHFCKGENPARNLVFKNAERYLARYTDALVTINEEDFKEASSFKLKPGGRVFQIPGTGLDIKKFRPPEENEREKFREALRIDKNIFFLVSAGELNDNKNVCSAIKAVSLLKKEAPEKYERIRFDIYGEGSLQDSLKKEIKKEGLSDRVFLRGYCKEINKIFSAADAFIFPSKREGLGMAALEALSCGVPVIAADNRGSREYMKNNKNGFVCPWNDPEAYKNAIADMMDLSREEKEKMKKESRKTAEGFSKEKTAEIMKEVYETCLLL